ncbi:MAG: amidohydrolase family protein, partial [Hyphomonadaceae bacterium]|nr:amidohydrolase family protein [Hyphomonadaceae bacterium]
VSALVVAACASAGESQPVTAFVGVTVIAAYGDPHAGNQTVLVRGDRIVAIGRAERVRVPAGARRIAGAGRILAPGLTDMHVHIFEPDDGVLLLANGVTSVRNMAGRRETAALAARIAAGEAPGPTIYSSTPIIDGPQAAWDNPRAVRTADEMRARIAQLGADGYAGVKLYENLSREAFVAGVEAARAHGMQVYAHVPFSMTLNEVLALRIDSIEHLTGFEFALAPGVEADWDEARWARADARNIAPAVRAVVASGVWNDTTLVTAMGARRAFADMAAAEADPLYRYATPRLRRHWRNIQAAEAEARDPAEAWAMTRRAHAARIAVVRALHEAGAPLLFGTDAPQPFVYPGYSLHDEFALHREAGLSPVDILRADTAGSARFLRQEGVFGRIAVGARADMLLLASDPEADMATLRAPEGVMAAGRWYDAATLQQMLDAIAARIASDVQP